VRGCPFGDTNEGHGCPWGCYAKEAVVRYHILFSIPTPMVLREDLLRKDLRKLREDWVRIGVMGEPSYDWQLTLRTARVCWEEGKRVVVVTRVFQPPQAHILEGLAELGATLNVSLCALDPPEFLEPRRALLEEYLAMGGRAVMRLVTFTFRDPSLQGRQEELSLWGGPVLEQPAKLLRTNPTFRLIRGELYRPAPSYVGKPRWLTAGPQLEGFPTCWGFCPSCPHKCLSVGPEAALAVPEPHTA